MRPNPIGVPLVPMLLVLGGLLACNLGSPLVAGPTPTPGGVQATSTDTPAPPAANPTPFDPSSLPSVGSMGRLSLSQGWVQAGGRLLWTEDAGGTWLDITPPGLPACLGAAGCPSSVDQPFFLDAAHAWLPVLQGQEEAPPTGRKVGGWA